MIKTTAFLYKWTELSTGKWYEGSRTRCGCHPGDGYICSSKDVLPLIINNPSNWVREILVIGEPKYIRNLETARLKLLDARNDPLSYNKHNADGTIDHATGRKWMNDGIIEKLVMPYDIEKFIKAGWKLGFSESHRKNNSKAQIGKTAHNKNKPMSEEQKSKLRKPKKEGSGANMSAARRAGIKNGFIVVWNKGIPSGRKGKPSGQKGIPRPGISNALKGKAPPNKGKQTPKVVSRLKDKKLMPLAHFTQWCNREEKKENKWKLDQINYHKSCPVIPTSIIGVMH